MPHSLFETLFLILVLGFGIVIVTELVSHLCSNIKRLYYLYRGRGRPDRAEHLWVNGARLSLPEFLAAVCAHFEVCGPEHLEVPLRPAPST